MGKGQGNGYLMRAKRYAVERKRAEEALADCVREMAALYQTSLEINSQPNISTLLYAIVQRAAELVGARTGMLYLVKPDGKALELVVGYNLPHDYKGAMLCLGEGLSARIAQTGEPLIIEDHLHWEGQAAVYADDPFCHVLGVPLKVHGNILGVINVIDDQKTGSFDEDQVRLVSLFADQAAIAVENARLVEALRGQIVELQARNEELDAFAHTVAHDLKSLVSRVVGFTEVLEGDGAPMPDKELQRYLHTIAQNGRKMGNVIDELLLLAGVRYMAVETRPLDMAKVVAEAQQRLAFMIREYQAEIVLPDASAWPVALGYGPWIEEVWVNYLSNAIQHGGRPPRVELGADPLPNPACTPYAATEGRGMVRFWAHDNGPGIAPEQRGRLFTPFARLNQVETKGHGLGLSIVRRIVEKLGGQVEAESQVGRGSVFAFTLPGTNGAGRTTGCASGT